MSKIDSETDRSKERLICTILIPVAVFLLCGGIYLSKRIEPHFYQAIQIAVPPIVWAFYNLVTYRTKGERVIAGVASIIAIVILYAQVEYLLNMCSSEGSLELLWQLIS